MSPPIRISQSNLTQITELFKAASSPSAPPDGLPIYFPTMASARRARGSLYSVRVSLRANNAPLSLIADSLAISRVSPTPDGRFVFYVYNRHPSLMTAAIDATLRALEGSCEPDFRGREDGLMPSVPEGPMDIRTPMDAAYGPEKTPREPGTVARNPEEDRPAAPFCHEELNLWSR